MYGRNQSKDAKRERWRGEGEAEGVEQFGIYTTLLKDLIWMLNSIKCLTLQSSRLQAEKFVRICPLFLLFRCGGVSISGLFF